MLKTCVYVLPAAIVGEANAPLLATTWWLLVSLFVHLTASPVLIVTLAGVNADAVILTALVAVEAGWDAPVIASASKATADRMTMRMS